MEQLRTKQNRYDKSDLEAVIHAHVLQPMIKILAINVTLEPTSTKLETLHKKQAEPYEGTDSVCTRKF